MGISSAVRPGEREPGTLFLAAFGAIVATAVAMAGLGVYWTEHQRRGFPLAPVLWLAPFGTVLWFLFILEGRLRSPGPVGRPPSWWIKLGSAVIVLAGLTVPEALGIWRPVLVWPTLPTTVASVLLWLPALVLGAVFLGNVRRRRRRG